MSISHFREGLGNIDIYALFHLVQISFYINFYIIMGVIFANDKHVVRPRLNIKSLFVASLMVTVTMCQ